MIDWNAIDEIRCSKCGTLCPRDIQQWACSCGHGGFNASNGPIEIRGLRVYGRRSPSSVKPAALSEEADQ